MQFSSQLINQRQSHIGVHKDAYHILIPNNNATRSQIRI